MDPMEIVNAIRELVKPGEASVESRSPDGDGVIFATKPGYQLTHRPGERRGVRMHSFAGPLDLAQFCNRDYASRAGSVDILVGEKATVVMPYPLDRASEILVMEHRLHPLALEWHNAMNEALSQRGLMQKLRAVRESLGDETFEAWMTDLGTLKLLSGGSFESSVDQLGVTTLRGSTQTREVTTRIRPTIDSMMPFFRGVMDEVSNEHEYPFEFVVAFDSDQMKFSLSCPQWELVRHEALSDLAAMLDRELHNDFLVVRGEASRRDDGFPIQD